MLAKFSVKKPYTVLVGVILVIVLGVVSFTRMTTDLLPDISLPYVVILTTVAGASPETVESTVTQPIEASMATVSNIETISSVSSENYSMVILEFAQSADMDSVSLEIRENLDQLEAAWDDSVGTPVIMRVNPSMLPVAVAAVGIEGMDDSEISDYVENTLMPELESLEGVASVSATGLLEESVNVIIRQDKIDEINEQIFAAIDAQFEEAEAELAQGEMELAEARLELLESQLELLESQLELWNSQQELTDGESTLSGQQDTTAEQLAATKSSLLTSKSELEATKTALTTNLSTAQSLDLTITEIDVLLALSSTYQGAWDVETYTVTEESENSGNSAGSDDSGDSSGNSDSEDTGDSVSGGDSTTGDVTGGDASGNDGDDDTTADTTETTETTVTVRTPHTSDINSLKNTVLGSSVLSELAASDEEVASIVSRLSALDWADSENYETVQGLLDDLSSATSAALALQRVKLTVALNSLTNGLELEDYESVVNSTLTTLNEKIALVDAGLAEVEKGELSAAIEYANANAQLQLSEYQLEFAQSQLESASQELDDATDQLDESGTQLSEAQEALQEQKESAYESMDLANILTVETVSSLLSAQNFSMPAGYVTEGDTEYLVRVGDEASSVGELEEMPILYLELDGVGVITLGDVADVFYTDNSSEIYTNVNGSSGVILTIQKQTGYSTGDVSDLLSERFTELMEENESLVLITLMDQGIYIDLVMDAILNNVLLGGLLAILILFLFLKDLRPTLVVACSIPVSLVTAIVCMYFSGVTLNVISLSGLALGIGMLVDNSIVVIENIYRMRSEGRPILEAAVEGAREVAGAIAASTLTTICVFLPIVFMEGITRQLFVDMGLTIAYALLASLLVALTVVPAMASKLMTSTKSRREGKLFGLLVKGYEKVLSAALTVKPAVLLLAVILLLGSAAAAMSKGMTYMPDMDSTQLTVSVSLENGTSLEETGQVTDTVVERLLEIDDVLNVGAMTGSSTVGMLLGTSGSATDSATIYVTTSEDKSHTNEELAAIILEETADLDAEISVDTSSMDLSALGGSGISIQIRGRDLDTLQEIASEVAAIVADVEGTTEVSDGLEETQGELLIVVDKEEAVSYNLTVAQVFSQVYTKLADATSVTTLVTADQDYSVYVTNDGDADLTRELLQEIEIAGTDENGDTVTVLLSDIADFQETQTLQSITREDQNRYVEVSASIADGYNVTKVSSRVQEALADYELPSGYSLVYSGENEIIMDAVEQVLLMLVLALIFMYLIMVAQFQSLLSPFIIMFTVPLAFTGGFLGLLLSGSEVSIIAMIGFVMLSGIIVNNGIVLIDYMNRLREGGMEKREAILTAGRTRLRPVLMTALTTILALSAMVFSNDMGSEIARPMAIVTIGGLLYGTLLTLVVIPCIYDYVARDKKKKEKKKKVKKESALLED